MTQLSLKEGLNRWGTIEKQDLNSEMKQLHLQYTFELRHFRDLTRKEKAEVLESRMFLKEKRSGEIKGRTVAGGNKQRDFILKEDASSPTVATDSVILTCIKEA